MNETELIEDFRALPGRYLTGDLAGIGGALKARNEDFVVEEIPSYEPCGSGEHIYLLIEKNGRPTLEVVQAIAKHFRVRPREVGYAGMKDKHAITRQYISVHSFDDGPIDTLDIPGVKVLRASRHRNRLRIGHLKGNRFTIRIREVDESSVGQALLILRYFELNGAPNYFGEQRFGYRGMNHQIGRAYLLQDWKLTCDYLLGRPVDESDGNYEARVAYERGDYAESVGLWSGTLPCERKVVWNLARGFDYERAFTAANQTQRRFFVSAFQSAIFNNLLDERIAGGELDRWIEGDVACKHVNGAMFKVGKAELDDVETIARGKRLEISPSGPLWGFRMMEGEGVIREREREWLARTGVEMDHFVTRPHDVAGARRPLRVPVCECLVEGGEDEFGSFVEVKFSLPKGSFATAILREIMKTGERGQPWGTARDYGG